MESSKGSATLPNILAFCRTFEEASFTKAARRLEVSPAATSRAVARLELQLGVLLFRRSTRQLRPTLHGEAYYARCSQALQLLEDAESAVSSDRGGPPRGTVRLSVGTTYGLSHLLERMSGFTEQYPLIKLDIQLSNHSIDFVREGFDMAIRLGRIDDAGLVARKLGEGSLGVFAGPRYLARCGVPRSVAELMSAGHQRIPFVMPRTGRVVPWLFASPSKELVPDGHIRCLDDPQGLLSLARANLGLVQTYHYMAAPSLAAGTLVEVLREHAGRTRPYSLVYPKAAGNPGLSAAARAVVAFVLERRLGK